MHTINMSVSCMRLKKYHNKIILNIKSLGTMNVDCHVYSGLITQINSHNLCYDLMIDLTLLNNQFHDII